MNGRVVVRADVYGLGSVIRVGVGGGSGFGLIDLVTGDIVVGPKREGARSVMIEGRIVNTNWRTERFCSE